MTGWKDRDVVRVHLRKIMFSTGSYYVYASILMKCIREMSITYAKVIIENIQRMSRVISQ